MHDIADARFEIEDGLKEPKGAVPVNKPGVQGKRQRAALVLTGCLILTIVGGILYWRVFMQPRAYILPVERLHVALTGTGLSPPTEVAISPDGMTIVFRATEGEQSRLYVRGLHDWGIRALEGTEGASNPCFSPDGESVAFMSTKGLQRVQVKGGAPVSILANAVSDRVAEGGMSWNRDGIILFSQRATQYVGVWSVPAKGGAPELLVAPDKDSGVYYLWPQMLPDGHAVLFTIMDRGRTSIAAFSLREGKLTTLVGEGSKARYLPVTGHLIYQSEGHMFGVPFDPQKLALLGEPNPAALDLSDTRPTAGAFDISLTGSLVYVPATTASLVWKDRNEVATPLPLKLEGRSGILDLSPDGHHAVFTLARGSAVQLYTANLDGDIALTRLTTGDADTFGVFTPDGKEILFTSAAMDGRYNIFSTRADGSGLPIRQTNSPNWQKATSVGPGSPGDVFLFNEMVSGSIDIRQQRLGSPETARSIIETPADELEGAFSPDGHWIAYESNASGHYEVYVKGYPDGPRRVVSINGGRRPVWNPRGGELFYQISTAVFAVQIVNGVRVGVPRRLFERSDALERNWDVAPDGERFLVAQNTRPPQINVITNWIEELKRLCPTK